MQWHFGVNQKLNWNILSIKVCPHFLLFSKFLRNPVISKEILLISERAWRRKISQCIFCNGSTNSPCWPTEGCLVWKWPLYELCFKYRYITDKRLQEFLMGLHVFFTFIFTDVVCLHVLILSLEGVSKPLTEWQLLRVRGRLCGGV